MAGLIMRVRRALSAAAQSFRDSPGVAEFAASTVRPQENNPHWTRGQMYKFRDLVDMFCGTVKVAASKNAAGIASNQLRIYKNDSRSAFNVRALGTARTKALMGRAGTLAQKAMMGKDEAAEIVDPEHPLVSILRNINPFNNPYDATEGLVIALGLTGNGYWKIARDSNGVPVEFWPLAPQFVHPLPDRENVIAGYVYGRGTEIEATYPIEDVIHFRFVNPRGDPFYGSGDLAACVAEARLGFEFVAMAQAVIDNGGNPGWLFYGPMTPDQRNQLEVSLQARTAGVKNAGRYVIASIDERVKVERQEMSEKEIAFLSSAERVDGVVYRCFDIPIELTKEKAGGLSGNSQARMEWQMGALQPRGRKIEETINAWVQREAAMGVKAFDGVFVAFDAWVQEDQEATHPIVIDAYSAGLLTKNEARMAIGQDRDPDPSADEYKAEPALITANAKADQAAAPQPKPKSVERVIPRLVGAIGVCTASLVFSPHAHANCCVPVGKEIAYNNMADEQERKMDRKLRAMLLALLLDIEDSLDADGNIMDIAASARARAAFNAATYEELAAAMRAGIEKARADSRDHGPVPPLEVEFEANERIDEWVRAQQDRAWDSVARTLQERAEAIIRHELGRGHTLAFVRQRLREGLQSAADTTPDRVSAFEVSNAYMTARERYWLSADLQVVKRWKTAKNPCPVCVAVKSIFDAKNLMPGKPLLRKGESLTLSAELGDLTASYADLFGPPLHPLCRCYLTLELL